MITQRGFPERTNSILDIEVVRDSEAFQALREPWDALSARAVNPHYFQSFDWIWAMWDCVARPKGRQLRIVVGRVDGRVVLIWPLMRQGNGHVRFIASDRGEYRDILVEASPGRQGWLEEAFDFVVAMKDVDVLHLQDLRSGSPLSPIVEARAGNPVTYKRPAPVIDLTAWDDFESYFGSLSGRLRNNQKRQWRRLGDIGEVRFETLTDPAEIVETACWIYDKKIEWQDERGISEPSFSCSEYRKFVIESVRTGAAQGRLHMARLAVGDRVAAAGMGYFDDHQYTFYMFAYDSAYETYSPGRLLMEKIIDWAMAKGCKSFDLMASTLDYKHRWTQQSSDVTDYLFACSALGRVVVGWYTSALRRRMLAFVWKNSPRILFGYRPVRLRRLAETALLTEWGDPLRDG